jgi:glycosyltransferase involved in cell wall biosynthesis
MENNKKEDIEFSILISTYQRKDGSTPFYLRRAIDSIFSQDYDKFKIFIIGDRYENNEEFFEICSSYDQKKIYFENLPTAKERDKYTDKHLLWKYGGCNAYNYAIEVALSHGFNYMCHLDHDDEWESNHLSSLKYVIDKTNAIWLCTKSKYGNTTILPRENFDGDFIEFYPKPEGLIHSSVCMDFSKIHLRYRDVYEETGESLLPGDADMWDRLSKFLQENNHKGYLVNQITCKHMEEGYELG